MAWNDYFVPNFNSTIDQCKLDLTTISPRVTNDVAERIPLENLLNLKDRSDKFISNIFRHRIDTMLANMQFFQHKMLDSSSGAFGKGNSLEGRVRALLSLQTQARDEGFILPSARN